MADDIVARTDELVAFAKIVLERVTPGPWVVSVMRDGTCVGVDNPDGEQLFIETYGLTHAANTYDAHFISFARSLVPKLVAEVERLRSYKSLPDGMVWQDYASPDDVCKIREPLDAEIERLREQVDVYAGWHEDVRTTVALCKDRLDDFTCDELATVCDDATLDEYGEAYRSRRDAALAEVERLHTWDGLMSLLDEHWPEDIFPTLQDDPDRDPGPRIVSLLRWVKYLTAEAETQRSRAQNAEAEVERLQGELQVAQVDAASGDDSAERWKSRAESAEIEVERLRGALNGVPAVLLAHRPYGLDCKCGESINSDQAWVAHVEAVLRGDQ